MTGETTTDDTASPDRQQFDPSQTSPLNLTDYNGSDHRGRVKLSFDESTLPSDADESIATDMDWAIKAVNAVVHHPNLALWVRSIWNDLVIAHEPHDNHERAGHLRVATFSRSDREVASLTPENETDAGLITPFDSVNVLYDFLVTTSFRLGYSMTLVDIDYLRTMPSFTHPIININGHIESWGRHQLLHGGFPLPTDRDRTAYAEPAYPDKTHDDPHHHAEEIVTDHVSAFAPIND